jgi:hypothetical protein
MGLSSIVFEDSTINELSCDYLDHMHVLHNVILPRATNLILHPYMLGI